MLVWIYVIASFIFLGLTMWLGMKLSKQAEEEVVKLLIYEVIFATRCQLCQQDLKEKVTLYEHPDNKRTMLECRKCHIGVPAKPHSIKVILETYMRDKDADSGLTLISSEEAKASDQ